MDFPEISAIIKTSIVYCKADSPLSPDSKKDDTDAQVFDTDTHGYG